MNCVAELSEHYEFPNGKACFRLTEITEIHLSTLEKGLFRYLQANEREGRLG